MTFLKSDPRRAERELDPLPIEEPAEELSPVEQRRAMLWKIKWAAQSWTREPGADPKNCEDRVLLRLDATWVPLIEIGGQRCYTWLEFLAWRRDHGGLTS